MQLVDIVLVIQRPLEWALVKQKHSKLVQLKKKKRRNRVELRKESGLRHVEMGYGEWKPMAHEEHKGLCLKIKENKE